MKVKTRQDLAYDLFLYDYFLPPRVTGTIGSLKTVTNQTLPTGRFHQPSLRPGLLLLLYSVPISNIGGRNNPSMIPLPNAIAARLSVTPWSAPLSHMKIHILDILYLKRISYPRCCRHPSCVLRVKGMESPGGSQTAARGLESPFNVPFPLTKQEHSRFERSYIESLRCYGHFYPAELHLKERLY
jgi:hypothetical protein